MPKGRKPPERPRRPGGERPERSRFHPENQLKRLVPEELGRFTFRSKEEGEEWLRKGPEEREEWMERRVRDMQSAAGRTHEQILREFILKHGAAPDLGSRKKTEEWLSAIGRLHPVELKDYLDSLKVEPLEITPKEKERLQKEYAETAEAVRKRDERAAGRVVAAVFSLERENAIRLTENEKERLIKELLDFEQGRHQSLEVPLRIFLKNRGIPEVRIEEAIGRIREKLKREGLSQLD